MLKRCTLRDAQCRVLTHPELHALADNSTRISVPRKEYEKLLKRSLEAPVPTLTDVANITTESLMHPDWLGNLDLLAPPKVLIPRESLENLVLSALQDCGLCFVVGPTGTGKSVLARSTTENLSDSRYWVDLRDIDASVASHRLKHVCALLADLGPATLALEDLNCLSHSSVQTALNEVAEAARRRDVRIVVTSYKHPTANALNILGVDIKCVVRVSNFTEKETHALVEIIGGDSKTWGRVAFLAGGSGHPQLTYAFLAGVAARRWPKGEIKDTLSQGFTNDDLEEEHRAARDNLFNSMPKPARELLHRLSIAIAPFERSLAVEIGALDPAIDNASESFDELVDRWLEPALGGRYRKSPLVQGLGKKMLTPDLQQKVHEKIATDLSNRETISVSDVGTILVHGLAGDSRISLLRLSRAIYMADEELRQNMASNLTLFSAFGTSNPIYARDLPTSIMLRIAQLRLVVTTEGRHNIAEIVEALLTEMDSVTAEESHADLEVIVLWFILNNPGIANDLNNWVTLLVRFRGISDELDGKAMGASNMSSTAALFSIGISGLDSVKRLEAIFGDLSELEEAQRKELLAPVDSIFEAYDLIVNYPVSADSKRPDFDATEAVDSYMRIVSMIEGWGIPMLTIQCRITIARILTEHLSDTVGALSVIHEAQDAYGSNPHFERAIAKIFGGIGQHTDALAHFAKAIDQMAVFRPVDAVYLAREAGICAAELEKWNKARDWFLLGQAHADPLGSINRGAISVGLGADAAVANFQAGDLKGALELLRNTLDSLRELGPDSSLQAAHCHRMVRHTILWLRAKVKEIDTRVAGQPIEIAPGVCSNPEPVPEIQQHPLGHIDFAWYMLAEIEIFSGLKLGIRDVVKRFGDQGFIPLSEHTFRTQILEVAIKNQNPKDFSGQFAGYLESATYCVANQNEIRSSLNALNPERVAFPTLPTTSPFDPITEYAARNSILAYGVHSVFIGSDDAMDLLRDRLNLEFGNSYPGSALFDLLATKSDTVKDPNDEIAAILRGMLKSKNSRPDLIFRAGLFLPKWIVQSVFNWVLIPHVKPWLDAEWRRIVAHQRFLLRSPSINVLPILEALNSGLDGERFAANLTLAAESAIGPLLDEEIRRHLRDVVRGT